MPTILQVHSHKFNKTHLNFSLLKNVYYELLKLYILFSKTKNNIKIEETAEYSTINEHGLKALSFIFSSLQLFYYCNGSNL